MIKGIDHSALQTCKAAVCRGNLKGDRKLVGKGARAIERIVAWENAQLKTPFRVGDVVLAKHDKSSCAWVDEDEARVSSLAYDAARRCAVLKIRYVNNPGGEVDALPHHLVPRVELGSRHAPSALNLADAVKAERFANAAATQQKRAAALATEMYDEKKRRIQAEASEHTARDAVAIVYQKQSAEVAMEQERANASDGSAASAMAERDAAVNERKATARDARRDIKALQKQTVQLSGDLLRAHSASSALALETSAAAANSDAAAAAATAEADSERELRARSEAMLAKLDSKSLSSLVAFFGSGDSAASRIKSLDALTTASSAVQHASKRCEQYKKVANVITDGLIDALAGGDGERHALLRTSISEHLDRAAKKQVRVPNLPPSHESASLASRAHTRTPDGRLPPSRAAFDPRRRSQGGGGRTVSARARARSPAHAHPRTLIHARSPVQIVHTSIGSGRGTECRGAIGD